MNLLENYILEVKSVEPIETDWTKSINKKYLKIVVVTECYGRTQEREVFETEEEWEKIKELGYFMW